MVRFEHAYQTDNDCTVHSEQNEEDRSRSCKSSFRSSYSERCGPGVAPAAKGRAQLDMEGLVVDEDFSRGCGRQVYAAAYIEWVILDTLVRYRNIDEYKSRWRKEDDGEKSR